MTLEQVIISDEHDKVQCNIYRVDQRDLTNALTLVLIYSFKTIFMY